jgi:hypothetical protein
VARSRPFSSPDEISALQASIAFRPSACRQVAWSSATAALPISIVRNVPTPHEVQRLARLGDLNRGVIDMHAAERPPYCNFVCSDGQREFCRQPMVSAITAATGGHERRQEQRRTPRPEPSSAAARRGCTAPEISRLFCAFLYPLACYFYCFTWYAINYPTVGRGRYPVNCVTTNGQSFGRPITMNGFAAVEPARKSDHRDRLQVAVTWASVRHGYRWHEQLRSNADGPHGPIVRATRKPALTWR